MSKKLTIAAIVLSVIAIVMSAYALAGVRGADSRKGEDI